MAAYKNQKIFDMLVMGAGFALKAAKSFREVVSGVEPQEQAAALKRIKRDAEKHMCLIRDYLNNAFITPIDKDDIYKVARKTDVITESIDSAAGQLWVMNVTYTGAPMKALAGYIVNACEELAALISEMKNHKKKNKMREMTVKINEIKETGDKCFESAVRELFIRERNPIELIKMKEIYGELKDVLSKCEKAADCVQEILITKT